MLIFSPAPGLTRDPAILSLVAEGSGAPVQARGGEKGA